MNHSPLPFKTLGPLLGLLAAVVGLSLANLSYLPNDQLTATPIEAFDQPLATSTTLSN